MVAWIAPSVSHLLRDRIEIKRAELGTDPAEAVKAGQEIEQAGALLIGRGVGE